ncbi:MAG: OstA-like protein [Bacteroidales bacterium]|jgi:lipopolysaccharide export system protein LptA|nr:OstA-like protein [Bacteroidales bacterium]
MKFTQKALPFLILIFFACSVSAQKKIDYKSDWGERLPSFPNQLILKSNVVFVHEGMTMDCDSAVFHTEENFIEAFGLIHISQDTIHLYGDRVYYDGNTKVAEIFGDTVILHDDKVTLQTDYMVWERDYETVRYTNAADIWDEESTLYSLTGTYYTATKQFEFSDNVIITSPDADIESDSLFYDSSTDWAYFYAPTTITTSDSAIIKTERGEFNIKTNQSILYRNNNIKQKAQTLIADSIDYNTETQCGKAFGNIFIQDTANSVQAYGNYLETDRKDSLKYAFLVGEVLLQQIEESDTLHMHSDTLWVNFDSTDNAEQMLAYNHVKVFRTDMQAACEYADYRINDSIVYLLERPVLWQNESQFTADTIRIRVDKKGVKQMFLYPNPFIVQNSDTLTQKYFNQISGKYLSATFSKNKISYAQIDGNINLIYHLWEEEKGKEKRHTGINIGTCATLKIYFEKGKPKKMTAVQNPDFYLDDEQRINEQDKTLKGFILLEEHRPKSPQDIFIHRD